MTLAEIERADALMAALYLRRGDVLGSVERLARLARRIESEGRSQGARA